MFYYEIKFFFIDTFPKKEEKKWEDDPISRPQKIEVEFEKFLKNLFKKKRNGN